MRKFPLVFQTTDPEGRTVGLNEEAWRHIQEFHPGVTLETIRATIENPDWIETNTEHGSLNYLFYRREVRFHRMVCVKEYADRNPTFEVSTAYSKATPPGGARVWTRPVRP